MVQGQQIAVFHWTWTQILPWLMYLQEDDLLGLCTGCNARSLINQEPLVFACWKNKIFL